MQRILGILTDLVLRNPPLLNIRRDEDTALYHHSSSSSSSSSLKEVGDKNDLNILTGSGDIVHTSLPPVNIPKALAVISGQTSLSTGFNTKLTS